MLFHLVAIFAIAFPAPVGGTDRGMWKDPTAQQEFASWAKVFGVTEPVFEEFLYQAAITYMHGRETVITPFIQYTSRTGCDQPWRMFVGPQRWPSRFQVQVQRKTMAPDDWATLFEEEDAAHRWHHDLFEQERLRSQIFRWTWPNFSSDYQVGCEYLARIAFAEDPTAVAFRCRFFKFQSPSPEQVRTQAIPPGAFVDPRTITRAQSAR